MTDPVSDAVEVIEHFYREGLTDGLPVVPPTSKSVERFLEASGVGAGEVLGTRASRNWRVTADKVAINAVMAGCLPEYAPVVVAAIRGLFEPSFNASAVAETTGASAAMVVINGSGQGGHRRELRLEPAGTRTACECDYRASSETGADERVPGDSGA